MITSLSYRYSHVIGFLSVKGRGFNNPVDMALGDNETMYVLNRAGSDIGERMVSKRISICTVDEDYVGEFAIGGSEPGQMMWPCAIAMSRDSNLFVSDEALNRISIFDQQANFLGSWGARGAGKGQFNRPAGLAFDADDNLLVVDGLNSRVQRYTKEGKYLGGWGGPGDGDGQFNTPWGISTDAEGSVYVADWRNDRIQKFTSDGGYVRSFGSPGRADGQLHRPSGVTVDEDGNLYVADWGNHRVQILDPDGNFVAKFRGDAGVSSWGMEYFRSNMDELEERRKADLEPKLDFPPDGDIRDESASIEKYFWGPTSVKLDNQGRMYVVDSCRHRVQIYQRESL